MRILTWNIHGARDASITKIAGEIAVHEADVVCLNEVKRRDGRRLGDALGVRAFVASSFIGPYGNVILTNEPVIAWHPFRFSRVRRVDRRDAAIITLADGTMIGAIHLGLRAPERSRSAAELLAALPDRAIVAGDANETPDRPAVRLFSSRFDDAGREGADPTFPAGAPHSRIDYVWVPRGTLVRACRVVRTKASDHLPVIVDIDPL
jgi:endonuclease/exonuclease/phosphatase family metal-dependent hydrolase